MIPSSTELTLRRVVDTWWPLAVSWLLMGVELPLVSAVMARLDAPDINLAAYGGIVFPLALLIESPIIMLLAASTALSKDWDSYVKLRRFMMASGAALTVLHALIVFTPLWHFIAARLIGAPPEIIEPARVGFAILLPWSWAIAYRRFKQGVLIRFGRSRLVGTGTAVRLASILVVVTVGYVQRWPGVVVAAVASAAGVVLEGIFAGIWVRPIVAGPLRAAPPVDEPLTVRSFLAFYIPLSLTSLLRLLSLPIASAGLSRMPLTIESLAAWPVLNGLSFMVRSLAFAFNEVVIALVDVPRSYAVLRRFARILGASTSVALLVLAATPLATLWFGKVSALSPALLSLAVVGLWMTVPLPALSTAQNFYQGLIVHGRATRGVPEAVIISLVTTTTLLTAGVVWGGAPGLYVGVAAIFVGQLAQTLWLRHRSRPVRDGLERRDRALAASAGAVAPEPAA